MTRTSENAHWMVRKNDMRIFRPIPQSELIQKIAAGEIAPNDELCAGNGYWFTLSEVNEVRNHLGDIDLSCLHSKDLGGDNTASTATRPLQKTSIIAEKVVLESASMAVKRDFRMVPEVKAEPIVRPEIVEAREGYRPERMKNAIGVAVLLAGFIFILVLIWSGSY